MSVSELPQPPGYGPSEFERTPPQDVAAEQCVLGGMMLSKDAIADVVETLRGSDFYKPAHQLVYDAVLDLYGRGEPADAVTVAAELTKRGEIGRAGGAPYLHTLINSVPTAANAGYYARIVRDRAVLRRLVEAGTRITQMGYTGDGEVDSIVDAAQAEVFAVTDRRSSEDYLPLSEIMEGTLDEIESIGSRGGAMHGVPTGFVDLDQLTNGFHGGQMIIIAARPAIGKALALDTPLPTPTGWTTMGEVVPGDLLIGADGRPTRVVAATEPLVGRPCYVVTFSDGSEIVADGQHQWLTELGAGRARVAAGRAGGVREPARAGAGGGAAVRTTAELAASLRGGRRGEHAVVNARPLDLPALPLAVPPYAVGVRLGVRHGSLEPRSLAAGWPDPPGRIPRALQRASMAQRRALLAGLLDAHGSVLPNGAVHFSTPSAALADDVRELVVGLGYGASVTPRRVGRPAAPRGGRRTVYTVAFRPTDEVFRSARKRLLQRRYAGRRQLVRPTRTITGVRPVPSVPVRCVQVDSRDQLYLAGRSMIPTHNSTLALDFARAASIKHGQTSIIFSLEMSRNEITMRLLSAEARVALHNMRSGSLSDDDWTRLARRMGEVSSAPLYIDDSPNLTMMEIRSKARRLRQRNDLRLIIIDYMQLMTSGKKVESRQQEVSEFSRSLKLLAKELEVPVIALSQLNRGPEMRTDKKPMLADLRESGCMTADTTLLRADTGAPVTFRQLLDDGHDGVLVWSLDESGALVPAPVTNVFPSGVKPVHRLVLASGREVKATGNHPFRTFAGWAPLAELAVGDRVAVPRVVPEPIEVGLGWSEYRLSQLARLIGEGAYARLPDDIHRAGNAEVATFLRHLWELGGHVTRPGTGSRGRAAARPESARASYAAPTRALADGVALLLARFGIVARIVAAPRGRRPRLHVVVDGPAMGAFTRHVGGGAGQSRLRPAAAAEGPAPEPVPADTLPMQAWDLVRAERERAGLTEHQLAAALGTADPAGLFGACPERRTVLRCAHLLDSDALRDTACSDVSWDTVVAIEPLGERPVYDATVKGTHNFVADGILAHNSLEQDADMVILLHREDFYEKESPRAGEADLIVAKHRNGPTATVTVAFQGHYSRFIDMAMG